MFNKNNQINKIGEIFYREYKFFYSYENSKSKPVLNQYAIWIDELFISHL